MRFELRTKIFETRDFAVRHMTTFKVVNYYLQIKNLKNGIKVKKKLNEISI